MKSPKTRTTFVALAIALPLSLAACSSSTNDMTDHRSREHPRRDVRHDGVHPLRHDDLVGGDGPDGRRLR